MAADGPPTDDPAASRTARLALTRPVDTDLDEVAEVYADPATWEHLPSGRHTSPATTARLLELVGASWDAAGLGSWVARDAAGRFVGLGGCDVRMGLVWNLGYRLAPAAWGQGYAAELAVHAVSTARRVRLDLPVTAYLLEHNVRSRRTAERAGLDLVRSGPDAGNPDPSAVRLLFADRPVAEHVVDRLFAT